MHRIWEVHGLRVLPPIPAIVAHPAARSTDLTVTDVAVTSGSAATSSASSASAATSSASSASAASTRDSAATV